MLRILLRSSFLTKGQLVAGNSKAWLMTNSRKELSFSDHTHSGYALTNHTHSNYALTSHTHSGYAATNHTHSQYVSQSTVQSMINNAASSIYYSGNIRKTTYTGSNYSDVRIVLNITSSTKFIVGFSNSAYLFLKGDTEWYVSTTRNSGRVSIYEFTNTSITFIIGGGFGETGKEYEFIYLIM